MSDQSVTARRAKKREQDRHAQRVARERTRNRIIYLEAVVSELKQQNTTKQMQDLWKQHEQITAQRDSLVQTLRAVERALHAGKRAQLDNNTAPLTQPAASREEDNDPSSCITGSDLDTNLQPNLDFDLSSAQSLFYPASESWPAPDGSYPTQSATVAPEPSAASESGLGSGYMTIHEPDPLFCTQNEDPIVPRPTGACDCSPQAVTSEQSAPREHGRGQLNLWRFANETLSESVEWSVQANRIEDGLELDTPVRAVLEGWDAVEQRAGGTLLPSWRKLRHIDEMLFSTCAKTERLAILRIMHSLLRYHQDPSPERRAALPQWYLAR